MADDRSIRVRLLADIQSYMQGMRQAGAASVDFGKQVSGMGKATQVDMDRIGRGAMLMAGGMAVGFGLAIKAAIDWESAFAGVAKTVDGTTSEMADLEDGLRDMARSLPATHKEIAAVAEAAGALGIARPAIESFTRTMIDLGETTNLTADQAATSIAQIANIMGTASTDFDRFGSTLVDLGNNGASTEAEILELANRLAAAGNIAGFAEADILGVASAMASVGINAEAGGTAMSKVITTMGDAATDGGEKLQTFARVAGVSASEFAAAFREDGAEALNLFIEGLGRMIESGQSVTPVFQELGLEDARLMNSLKSLAGQATIVGESLDMGRQAWDDNSALAEEAGKRYGTTAAQLEILRNQVVDLGIDIGGSLVPTLRTVASGTSSVVAGFSEMPGPLQQVGAGAGLATTALLGFVAIAPRISAAKAALQGMGAAGQFVGNNMGKLALGLGAVGVAFTAYSYVLGQNAKKQAEAEAAAEALTDAMKEQGSVAGELSRETISAALLDGDVGTAFRQAGGDIEILTEAVQNNGDALGGLDNMYASFISMSEQTRQQVLGVTSDVDVLASVLEEAGLAGTPLADELLKVAAAGDLSTGQIGKLLDRLGDQGVAVGDAADDFHNLGAAERSSGDAAEESARQRNDAVVALQGEETAVQAVMDAYDEWEKQQRAITDPIFGVQQAVVGLRDAQLQYTDSIQGVTDAQTALDAAIAQHGAGSAEAAEATRDYENAVRDWQDAQTGAIDAAAKYDSAVHKLGAAIQANPGLLDMAIGKLQEWVTQGAITQEQADAAAESFRLLAMRAEAVPGEVGIEVTADTSAAERRLAALRTTLQGLANQGILVQGQAGVAIRQAAGGIVPGTGSGDIVPAMLEPGEFVVRRSAAEAIGYDALYRMNRFANGGRVGGVPNIYGDALASNSERWVTSGFVGGTMAGKSVSVVDDIEATNQALGSLADEYLRLRDSVGEATATQLLYSAETADEFSRLASGAEEAMDRVDRLLETGQITRDEALGIWRDQLAGLEPLSDGWYSTWQKILRAEADALREQRQIEDARFELGWTSTADRRAQLVARLDAEVEFTQGYMEAYRELDAFDEALRAKQVARDRDRMGDLVSRRQDAASLYIEAKRQAEETGGNFEYILAQLQADADAERALQAEADRYALANVTISGDRSPEYDAAIGAFGDPSASWSSLTNGTWSGSSGGGDTYVTQQFFPDATIRETVNMTAAWQQVTVARNLSGGL